ncbi:hypothetical protein [Halomicronema sp. CCY15110]|uniref:hypothetical protein n=1 Tax=Halomicronema sp. CCY15110 TaxID=2767773 RepID=UPI00194F34BC|nr:hypothetical protein [Halomicronema sp. CCY15110]
MEPSFDEKEVMHRVDDGSISDDEKLWRRIVPSEFWVKRCEDGTIRPTSAAFLDGITNEVSVCRESLTTVEDTMLGYEGQGLVEILASFPRSLNHLVVADPIPKSEDAEGDPSHALICPPEGISPNNRKKSARKMAMKAVWVVEPELDFIP